MTQLRIILLLITCSISSSFLFAQDDSAFAQIYRKVREMTDGLKTYNFYLIPYQSSQKIQLGNSYQKKLASVFHFLKAGKTVSVENPDFIIGVLVDNQRLFDPSGGQGFVTRSANENGFVETAIFTCTYTVLIHTKNRETIRFKLDYPNEINKNRFERPQHFFNDRQKDSLSRTSYSLSGTTQTSSSFIHRELLPTIEDHKYQLGRVLDSYKNRYVDRVYN